MQAITAQDLKHMWDRGEDFLLVNTLPTERFAETKVLAAVNIPEDKDDFAGRVLHKAGAKDRTILLYSDNHDCHSATHAAQKLLDASFEDVWIFEDGAEGWREFAKSKSAGAGRW